MSSNTHCFSVSLAEKVGLECAIILQHFYTWHRGNKDNPDMNKDKRVWFFLSRKSILEVFPYLTDRKIRNSIESLIASGYVVKGNYNKDSFKKANWYSMTDKAIALFEEKSNPLDEKSNDWSKSPLGYSKENIENIDKETNKESQLNFPYHSSEFMDLWNKVVKLKKWKSKDEGQLQYSLDKLAKVSEGDAIKALQETYESGWQGVFPKTTTNKGGYSSPQQTPPPINNSLPKWKAMGFSSQEEYLKAFGK